MDEQKSEVNPTPPPLTGKAKRLANLRPWKKGEYKGNPHGNSRKNWSVQTWMKHIMLCKTSKILEHQAPDAMNAPYAKLPALQAFLERQFMHGMKGNTNAARLVLECAYGPLEQHVVVKHESPDADPWREKILALMKDQKNLEHLLALAEASVKETPPEKP